MTADESRCGDPAGDCDQALEALGQYLDGELPEHHLDSIRDHLAACYPCADRADFEEQLRAIVRERCTERAPDGLVDRIRAHLDEVG